MYKRKPKGWVKHLDFILLDIVVLQISFFCANYLRHGTLNPYYSEMYRHLGIAFIISDLFVSMVFNTFSGILKGGYYKTFASTVKHVVLVSLFVILYMFSTQTGAIYSRLVIVYTSGLHVILGYLSRLAYRRLRRKYLVRNKRILFLVTTSKFIKPIVKSINDDASREVVLKEAAVIDKNMTGSVVDGVNVVADSSSLTNYLCHEWVDEIYLRVPRDSAEFTRLYTTFMEMGLTIHVDLGGLSLYKDQNQELNKIGDSLVLTAGIKAVSVSEAVIKRLFDIIGGLVGSVFALLVMLTIAIPLKIKSPGPVLYKSERIGLNGKRFKMYKIRTMRLDAESMKASLMKDNRVKDNMMFKLDWDPRVIGNKELPDGTRKTGIGEFLRKTSLDEFPQFFNVLGGSMSLVGTRPPTPDEWERYGAHHRARLATKPGITGLWQVSGRSEITDFEEIVRLDTEYITNWSFAADLRILVKTFITVFTRKGAL